MKRVSIDCRCISTRERLHDALAHALCLPPWYGRNLDALHDCLADIHEDTSLTLLFTASLEQSLGSYARTLMRVLRNVQNPHFFFYCT